MHLSTPGEHLMCDRSRGHKVRKVEAELLFIMARKVAPGLGTTGNDGGEESPALGLAREYSGETSLSKPVQDSIPGPRSSQSAGKPFQASGSPCDRALCLSLRAAVMHCFDLASGVRRLESLNISFMKLTPRAPPPIPESPLQCQLWQSSPALHSWVIVTDGPAFSLSVSP